MDNCALVALQSYRVPKDRDFGIWTQARRVLYSAPVPSGAKGACSLRRVVSLLIPDGSYLDALSPGGVPTILVPLGHLPLIR